MKTIDIKTYSGQLQQNLKAKLEAIGTQSAQPLARSSKCLLAVNETVSELKEFVYKYEFQNSSEEIEFFKEIKPVLISQYYYYEDLISLKVNEPLEKAVQLSAFYQTLSKSQLIIKDNIEFYTYCLSGATYMDGHYFTRNSLAFKSPDVDTRFSTGFDNILSKILAHELIRNYVDGQIRNLNAESNVSPLIWTAKKAYLVELIYALHGVEAFNNGKVELKQIATLFESLFNVTLGNFYRQFQEIGFRKGGRTTFIDQLKEKLAQRLDEQPSRDTI